MIFSFRQFEVRQEKAAMKIGTDSVLLGCLCNPGSARSILDIGTGTGILSLMLAQKSAAQITALEIDADAAAEAGFNFTQSKWADRLQVLNTPFQQLPDRLLFDLIITNPPFYRAGKTPGILDEQRSRARHDGDLPFETLATGIKKHLNMEGVCWMILPLQEGSEFIRIAHRASLYCSRMIRIRPLPGKPVNRVVLCFSHQAGIQEESEFTIYSQPNEASTDYIELTREFYLWKGLDNDPRLKR